MAKKRSKDPKQYEVKVTVRTLETGTDTFSLYFDYPPIFSSIEIKPRRNKVALLRDVSDLEWLNKNAKSRVAIHRKK